MIFLFCFIFTLVVQVFCAYNLGKLKSSFAVLPLRILKKPQKCYKAKIFIFHSLAPNS